MIQSITGLDGLILSNLHDFVVLRVAVIRGAAGTNRHRTWDPNVQIDSTAKLPRFWIFTNAGGEITLSRLKNYKGNSVCENRKYFQNTRPELVLGGGTLWRWWWDDWSWGRRRCKVTVFFTCSELTDRRIQIYSKSGRSIWKSPLGAYCSIWVVRK